MEIFDFDDINLIPKKGVNSRSECETTVSLGKHFFKVPIIPANMRSIINIDLAEKLATNGYFYIMHRFDIDILKFVEYAKSRRFLSSISIGVNDDSYVLLSSLLSKKLFPDYITIDIAHGHCGKMEVMLRYLKFHFPNTFVIGGNVCTPDGVIDLELWGADAVKVGISCGSVCTTYFVTGFGSRGMQASTILECAKVASKPLIADGGIQHPSDITKALVMGATMVMGGNILSSFVDSPGEIVRIDGINYKQYWGSASEYENKTNRIEGKKILNILKDKTMIDELEYLKECLQSSISYAGGNNLSAFNTVDFLIK